MRIIEGRVLAVGTLLITLGASAFAVRQQVEPTELAPAPPENVWRVELNLVVLEDGRATVRVVLPHPELGPKVLDEAFGADEAAWAIERDEKGNRLGRWRGTIRGEKTLRYRGRLELDPKSARLPTPPAEIGGSDRERELFLEPFSNAPARSRYLEHLKKLDLPPEDDPAGRTRAIHAFVKNEVEPEPFGPSKPDLTLRERYGNTLGRARLLVQLARAAGLPARTILGLELRESGQPDSRVWAEIMVRGGWFPLSPSGEIFGSIPSNLCAWSIDDGSSRSFAKTDATIVDHRVSTLPVMRSPRLLADETAPTSAFFRVISPFTLPLSTQSSLHLLFLLPIGALAVAVLRVGVGLQTFGSFLPVLLALAFRETSLGAGLLLTGGTVVVGVLGRLALGPLNLLHFPRASSILSIVVVSIAGSALLGRSLDWSNLLAGIFFPVVILTLLIERFSLTIEEEGYGSAMSLTLQTIVAVIAAYPIMNNAWLEYAVFAFPEILLVAMGLMVLIGGYKGYRLLDYWRFRFLQRRAEASLLERPDPPPEARTS